LPDPFAWFDGSLRDTSFASWERRRNEIKAAIENYEIGPKPDPSDVTVTAAYANGILTVVVTRKSNLRSLRLTSHVNLPSGTGPFPAVIAMSLAPSTGANTGSLPSDIFTSRNIATIDYVHDDVTQYAAGQQIPHTSDPYFLMYPEYAAGPCPPAGPCGSNVGQYSAWAWGVSRLIDGLEIVAHQPVNPLPIDLKHLGVTGCSYAGKMALFAGAFDERVALTIAQENGGGGAPAWRVSQGIEPNGTVEKQDNTDGSWFMQTMKSTFAGDNVYKMPHDHHELMAMVAPRALLETGNTDFTWLSNRSNYVSARATQKIYETLGVGDRFGFYIDGGHSHCATLSDESPVIAAFVDKFLLDKTDTNTDVHIFPQTDAFLTLDYQQWTDWWGTGPRLSYVEQNVTSLVTLQVTNSSSDNGTVSFDLALSNSSTQTIFAPLRVKISQLTSASGNVTVNNADNGQSGVGADWDYSNTVGSDNMLSPGETSTTRTLQFRNQKDEPYTVTFSIIASGTSASSSSPTVSSSGSTAANGANSTALGFGTGALKNAVLSVTYNPLLKRVTAVRQLNGR
jgi:hypothetical protein